MTIHAAIARTAMLALFASGTAVLAAGTGPNGETLADSQTFTYRILDEFPTLDPQLIEESVGSDIARDLFEGLVNQDAEGNLVPGVATSWEESEGNKVWTFHLRDAKWSNGDPLTAGDFVYAWERAADPATASNYAWYVELASIANAAAIIKGDKAPDTLGVKALDDHTLQVTLDQPTPYFPSMTSYATFSPAPKATIEKYGADWTKPGNMVSNGAYVLTQHVPSEYSVRERNTNYWDDAHTTIDKVTALVINDENLALTRYLAGELDRTEVPAGQYPDLKEKFPEAAVSFPNLCSYYYAINERPDANPALQDERVRRALSLAIDRDVLVKQVLKGGQYPAYTLTHVKTAGFVTPDVAAADMTQKERDTEAARLMDEAGYGKGGKPLSLNLIYNTSEAHKALATVASQMWKQKLGIDIRLNNMEWKTYLDIRKNGEFDLARSAWCGDYNEASTFLNVMTTGNEANDGHFSSAEFDDLMAKAKTEADPEPTYTKAEKILEDASAIVPVYHYTSVYMLNPKLKGYPFDNVQGNWYSRTFYKVAE